ncbi:MAG: aminodeoxychorismate/anthranilate synthase component II [Mariprofundaceae bacterium]|nr:aminodeoxychorismate/anthranilate synthase component II [Mariprofundaceae bacterium]
MMLVIDNYDSFTFNLVQYLGELGQDPVVKRNDHISLDDIEKLQPHHILISPGPCTPKEAGISVALIQQFSGRIPILGVCLGHQSIAKAFGGHVIRAPRLMHGKVSPILHQQSTMFQTMPSPFTATRYHSLIVEEPLPECLEATAWTAEGELMALQHCQHPTFGLQFHPESILTEHGHTMLKNFLEVSA